MKHSFGKALLLLAGTNLSCTAAAAVRARQDVVTVTQTVQPTPEPTPYDWASGATTQYPIHGSCNGSERALLSKGINEAIILADHAKQHILRFGNSSDFYTKYFGSAPTAEAIGWYDKIVSADRSGIWFRCDDIDGNCHQDGWGGHWRGENATSETVICPLSYTTRMPLEGMCAYGYTVAAGELAFYFGSDLIHRLYHMPPIGEAVVEHYADTYAECLELAMADPAMAVRNSHTLQYFALDVYAFDIALPGEGCTGLPPTEEESEESADSPVPTATATSASNEPSSTQSSPTECHTHADGTEHCS